MRFNLEILLLAVLFLGGMLGCWFMRDPYQEWKRLPPATAPVFMCGASAEGKYIATTDLSNLVRVFSFPDLTVVFNYKIPTTEKRLYVAKFVGVETVGLVIREYRGDDEYHFTFPTGTRSNEIELLKLAHLSSVDTLFYGFSSSAFEFEGIKYKLEFEGPKGNAICIIKQNRYPEKYWYGHLYRPEVWITIFFGIAVLIRILMQKNYKKLKAASAPQT